MNENTINNTPPVKFERDENGLLKHIQYYFTENGFVDWRKMVPNKYLYLNPTLKERPKLEKKYGKPYKEIDIVNDKVEDKDLTILLGGIHYLVQLRGFTEVLFNPVIDTESFSSTVCLVKFISNFESENRPVVFSALAHACHKTTNGFGKNYLSEMASNRAFCRAVRFFLQLGICSKEELIEGMTEDNDINDTNGSSQRPFDILKNTMTLKNVSFEYLKSECLKNPQKYEGVENWKSVDEIPKSHYISLVEMLQNGNDKLREIKIQMSEKGISFDLIKKRLMESPDKYKGANEWKTIDDVSARYHQDIIDRLSKVKK